MGLGEKANQKNQLKFQESDSFPITALNVNSLNYILRRQRLLFPLIHHLLTVRNTPHGKDLCKLKVNAKENNKVKRNTKQAG